MQGASVCGHRLPAGRGGHKLSAAGETPLHGMAECISAPPCHASSATVCSCSACCQRDVARVPPKRPTKPHHPAHSILLQLNITCLLPPEKINYGTVALAVEVFQPLPSSNEPVQVREPSRPACSVGTDLLESVHHICMSTRAELHQHASCAALQCNAIPACSGTRRSRPRAAGDTCPGQVNSHMLAAAPPAAGH